MVLASGKYEIRFRHSGGDVGPFAFPVASNVTALKEKLLLEWPTEVRGSRPLGRAVVAHRVGVACNSHVRPALGAGRWQDAALAALRRLCHPAPQ